MGLELRMPNITGSSEREQLAQIKSYLYQFIPQLQWALNTLDTSASSNYVAMQSPQNVVSQKPSQTDEVSFEDLKAFIIKSADIVQAYYEEISTRLSGVYVAQSDFGTFVEQTEQTINRSSTDIEQAFKNLQQITSDIENITFAIAETNAHIRSGILYYDENQIPVYGVEVGQINEVDGVEVFNRYARFTSGRLSFYDHNGIEVAYISDKKLYITHVEITETYRIGRFVDTVLPDSGVVTKWI